MAWQTDWEKVGTGYTPNILTAACRPAGFLKYTHASLLNSGTPICAQAASAGSGALAYSLVWYGNGNGGYLNSYITNVELNSGPVFGDIELGCEVGPASGERTGCRHPSRTRRQPRQFPWQRASAFAHGFFASLQSVPGGPKAVQHRGETERRNVSPCNRTRC